MSKDKGLGAVVVDHRTPVRSGARYCSRGCGIGCTKAAYDRAVREAAALAKTLGEGWEPEVWENLGWHWRAGKGVTGVYPTIKGGTLADTYTVIGYTAYFNTAKQVVADAATPQDALGFAIQDARTIAARIAADCDALL